MKISYEWLSDFVDWTETDPAVIADRMTRCMGEVDDIVMQGAYLKHCVVGKVLTVEKHPDADKLAVCTVETDQGTKTVVCGGTNVRQGMLVAFAHIGATVKWHGGDVMTLKPVKIRGVESAGMICAQEELGLTQFPPTATDGERPIVDMSAIKAKVGTPIAEALGLGDVVFHIDNHAITHRPDLFSHVGIAREVVAMGLATWKKKSTEIPKPKFPSAALPFDFKNEAPDLVPMYNGCMISIDGPGVTPDWMKRRLEATGWRSINLVVDITNYVLMEIGMPLHAFDADDFKGTVHIRQAKKGEQVTTLDGTKREISLGSVIMSDDEGIFDLFGVMGGLRTSNKPTTKNIFVQAGVIKPESVRRTIIAMGHRTDAGTVYEKGLNLDTAQRGLFRAVQLFLTLHPGAKVSSKLIEWGKMPAPKAVKVSTDTIASVIGAEIKPAVAKKILTDLGYDVKGSGAALTVEPPLWRTDTKLPVDVIEEVSRIYGYANVTPEMPEATTTPPPRDHRMNRLRDSLKEERYTELLNLAFASPSLVSKAGFDPKKALSIENPLGEELSLMRPSLLPAMLQVMGREIGKSEESHLKCFEYGNIFAPDKEVAEFALIVAAKGKTTLKDEPVLIAKADLTRALADCGYSLQFSQTKDVPSYAHAGRSAEIKCQGKKVGMLMEIHPQIAKAFDLQSRTAAAVLDLELLKTMEPTVKLSKPLAAFPSVEFDETVLMPKSAYGAMEKKLKSLDPLLTSIRIVNLYESAEAGKNLTIRFTYRAADRTLKQEEVEKVHAKVVAELKKG